MTESFMRDLLASGEVVLIETRQHWVAAVRYVLRPIVILLIAAGLVLLNSWLGWDDGILGTLNQLILWIAALLFIVSIVWLPIDLVRWWSRKYVLTNRRAMRMQGVLRKSSIDSSLEQINDIRTEQSLVGRTLGYADLTIYTASDVANERYAQLLDGLQFKKAVLEAKNAIREGQPLEILPDDFIVKGGTNEASIRKYGKASAEEAPAEAAPIAAEAAAPVAPVAPAAAPTAAAPTAAAVMAASGVIEPSGEVASAAELAPPVEPAVAADVMPEPVVVPSLCQSRSSCQSLSRSRPRRPWSSSRWPRSPPRPPTKPRSMTRVRTTPARASPGTPAPDAPVRPTGSARSTPAGGRRSAASAAGGRAQRFGSAGAGVDGSAARSRSDGSSHRQGASSVMAS